MGSEYSFFGIGAVESYFLVPDTIRAAAVCIRCKYHIVLYDNPYNTEFQ